MTGSAMETNHEDVKIMGRDNEEEVEEEGENHGCDAHLGTNSSSLVELNLILMLSFLSLSPEECSDLDEIDKEESVKHLEARDTISRLKTRKREINEFKVIDRTAPRFQTKIRDCRHCRRM